MAYDGMLLTNSAIGFLDMGLNWATLSAIAATDGFGGHALIFSPELGSVRLGASGGVLWREGKAWPTGTGLLALDVPLDFSALLAGRYGQGQAA